MANGIDWLDIESLDLEGRGIAHRDGKVIFVAGALPGERVRAQLRRSKPSFETAETIEVLRDSALRVRPRCPHFGVAPGQCGGCAMQHLEPAGQVAVKQRALEDALWDETALKLWPKGGVRGLVGTDFGGTGAGWPAARDRLSADAAVLQVTMIAGRASRRR